jgi:hypothetical protein
MLDRARFCNVTWHRRSSLCACPKKTRRQERLRTEWTQTLQVFSYLLKSRPGALDSDAADAGVQAQRRAALADAAANGRAGDRAGNG